MELSKRILVGGCPVDRSSFEGTVADLCRRINERQKTHVVFVNAAKIVRYRQNSALRQAVDKAEILLADGVPVVWASKLKGTPLPGRVNGTDLMERMLSESAKRGYRVFLLGARPEVIQRVAKEVRRRHPRLIIAGYRNGYFEDQEHGEIVREINESRADLLLLGMNTPLKEVWGDSQLPRLEVSVCQGVGGSFDVLAGVVRRAPLWMQKFGLEWLYRMLQEPARLSRRYLETNSAFVWYVLADLAAYWRNRLFHNQN